MAGVAYVSAGKSWTGPLHEAATAWMTGGDPLPGFFWGIVTRSLTWLPGWPPAAILTQRCGWS